MTDPRKPGPVPAENTGADHAAKKPAKPGAPVADDRGLHPGLHLGEWTGMLTGHSTRDPDTTRPGSKTTGPGEMGNFMKNQKE
ncbi:hypothetical protein [Roseomonas sp. 18066]|uniref:hypothetical protein n=1 Tax=Roseomonas sp. 18066 TaxID=2681412 RepID=UPI00135BB11F|nr:hypothetical protein [Roseomonas sp. 18066]